MADLSLPTCPFVGMVGSEFYDGSSLKEIQRSKGKRGQRFVDVIASQTLSTIHFPDRGFWAPRPLGMRSFADCRAIWLHQQQWTLFLLPDTHTQRKTCNHTMCMGAGCLDNYIRIIMCMDRYLSLDNIYLHIQCERVMQPGLQEVRTLTPSCPFMHFCIARFSVYLHVA